MIVQTPWKERCFNFDFPPGLFPVILERLQGTSARIRMMIGNVTEENASLRINSKWSIKDHIGHLHDLEELHEGRIDDFMDGKETLRAWDTTNQKTEEANHNSKSLLALTEQFDRTRQKFIERLTEVDDNLVIRVSLHPRLRKPMRLVDMAYFVSEHDDHHLTRIRSIIESFQ